MQHTLYNCHNLGCDKQDRYAILRGNFVRKAALLTLLLGAISGNARAEQILKVGSEADSIAGTCQHKTIKYAYAGIATPLTEACVIELQSSYDPTKESYPITFTAKDGASASNTITIRPATGAKITLSNPLATVVKTGLSTTAVATVDVLDATGIQVGQTIFGTATNTSAAFPTVTAITGSTITAGTTNFSPKTGATLCFGTPGTKTIRFAGASNVIIDGIVRNDASTGLTIQNPNSIIAKTITFEGADNGNIIRNCTIKGANISGDANNNGACAQIHFMTTHTGKNNVIENNDVCDVDGSIMPISMFSFANVSGGATDASVYNTVQNNNIYNFNVTATSPAGNVGAFNFPSNSSPNVWVLNNKIYWTKTLENTTNDFYVFGFGSSSAGAGSRVEGNVVGGTASDNSGIANFNFNKATFSVYNVNDNTTLKNNTVKNLNITAPTAASFYGIRITSKYPASVLAADAWSGNTVKDITISAQSTTAQAVGFTIGSAATQSARNISNNEISGINIACSTPGTQVIVRGIQVTGTASTALWNFSGNRVFNLTAGNTTSTSANTIIGLDVIANTAVVEKNLIYNLKPVTAATTRTGVLYGFRMTAGNTTGSTIKNNVVCLGYELSNDLATLYAMDQAGTLPANAIVKYYNNSVYVGGNSGDNSVGKSYAFYSAAGGTAATTYDIKNNIFVNQRVNGATPTATAKHYAFGFATANVVKSCDNNLYHASPLAFTGSQDKADLTAWKDALQTGSDAASISGDPLYTNPTASTPDLHLTSGTPANKAGVDVSVAEDFDGLVRADYTPVDLGAYVISGSTSIGANTTEGSLSVVALNERILFSNLAGQSAKIFTVSGQLVKSIHITSNEVSVSIAKGLYIVQVAGKTAKVAVK